MMKLLLLLVLFNFWAIGVFCDWTPDQEVNELGEPTEGTMDEAVRSDSYQSGDDGNERLNDLLPLPYTQSRFRYRRARNMAFPIRYERRPRFRSVQSSLVHSGNIADLLADHFGVKHNKVLRYGIS